VWTRVVILLLVILVSASCAFGSSFSFTGTFLTDDRVELLSFTVGAPSTVTMLTYGYGGGVNAASTTVDPGGFLPNLTLFDSAGNLITADDNTNTPCNSNGQNTRSPLGCGDDFFQESLAAGSYVLALTVYDNTANGLELSDGFAEDGQGNFTCGEFFTGTGAFCDPFVQDNGGWAVDVLGVNTAGPVTGTPEPGTALAVFGGLVTLYFMRRASSAASASKLKHNRADTNLEDRQ